MKSTTGAEPTALSIAARVSVERNREDMGESLEANVDGRAAWRNACCLLVACRRLKSGRTDESGLENILVAILYGMERKRG